MTINDLIRAASEHQLEVLVYFLIPPLLIWGTGRLHKTRHAGERRPYNLVYATSLYLVSFPGVLAAVLTGYGLLFLRADLRNVPILLYFLPILSMVVTWVLAKRQVNLDRIPGFERLTGFMLAIAICFAVAFALNRLFFGVLFFGSFWGLVIVAVGVFVLFRISMRRMAG